MHVVLLNLYQTSEAELSNLLGEDSSSRAIPLLQLSDWSRELCVLEEPPLNHDSLGWRWTHYQIAGSIGERRHTH